MSRLSPAHGRNRKPSPPTGFQVATRTWVSALTCEVVRRLRSPTATCFGPAEPGPADVPAGGSEEPVAGGACDGVAGVGIVGPGVTGGDVTWCAGGVSCPSLVSGPATATTAPSATVASALIP